MTSYSANGWSVVSGSRITSPTVPGTTQRLPVRAGDVATVLLYVATRFHREVESLHKGWCWGFAVRPIRGQTYGYSNHASGTAIDLNAPRHPRGRAARRNFTSRQIAVIRDILKECDGVIRWGGDFTTVPDPMHFEVNAGPGPVGRLASKIRAAKISATLKPATSVAHVLVADSPYRAEVALLQKTLDALPGIALKVDGDFGPATGLAVRRFKASSKNASLRADAKNVSVGKATVTSLGLKWAGQ